MASIARSTLVSFIISLGFLGFHIGEEREALEEDLGEQKRASFLISY
jgi:hypothetical protein